MREAVRRIDRPIVVLALFWFWTAGVALAQPPDQGSVPASSLAAVSARVPAGGVVLVTDAAGTTIKGRLQAVTAEGVQLTAGNAPGRAPARGRRGLTEPDAR